MTVTGDGGLGGARRGRLHARVITYAGGKGGGGAKLTDEGHKVLKLFRDMELKAQKSLIKEKAIFSKLIS